MGTQVISRSGQLARPGEPLVETSTETSTTLVLRPRPDIALPPPISAPGADASRPGNDPRLRELRWVCEWWPPD